ncbi:MAG: DUF3800 domain-containing protein [Faecalicoccus sp.]|nr:DUF3800 domain-containing protein [Faecalicoccus sp.]
MINELSVFVDESGDWGDYDFHSPYYIVSFVFHDQKEDIHEQLSFLNNRLKLMGFPNHCIHSGPIIRGEDEYRNIDKRTRQHILRSLITFIQKTHIQIQTFYIEKKHIENSIEASGKLGKLIARFIKSNYSYFTSFDIIKVYYDNGQIELNKILSSVFNSLLDNVIFRKVLPKDYSLFQVADLACTLKLTELKMAAHLLSKSESNFFENERTIKKNYLKPVHKKIFP